MKQLLTFLLLIPFSILGAQDYVPIPTSGAAWSNTMYGVGGGIPSDFYVCGDTMISGREYHKLYVVLWGSSTVYGAAYRNDSEEKKVWLIPMGSTEEKLLYDFDLEVGQVLYWPDFTHELEVVAIETITLSDGEERRAIRFGKPYPELWIEGIGSTRGFGSPGFVAPDATTDLNCFYQDNEVVLHYSGSSECDFSFDFSSCGVSTSVENVEIENEFQIFPTKVDDGNIQVKWNPSVILSNKYEIRLHDISGKELLRSELIPNIELPTNDSGIYFFTIHRKSTGKVVRTERVFIHE